MRSALDVLAEDDAEEAEPTQDAKPSAPIAPRATDQPAGPPVDRLAG